MADVKISDLVSANVVNKNDLFLLVQDDSSKNVSAGTLFSSITDPTLSGNIFIGGNVQSLSGVGTVSVTTTRTDLYGGVSADAAAIANGSVLPSTIYLYTDGKSASGRGLQFQDGTPFFKTIYVQHINGKINLSLGANATGTLNHAPDDWVGTTGLRPFNDGLYFVKGASYTFDVSHPTNAGNIIGLSTSIDGTNTLGTEYTAGVVRTGNPGNTGATVEFIPANVSIDQGGRNYLDIPKGVDGQLKVINLVSTAGGQFVISSNIQNNLAIELRRAGDSAFLMYSGNAWILVGSNPGLQTSFSGTSDDIPEGQKLYFTNARARAAISVPDNTLIYNATTGSIRANVLALSNINLGNIIPNSDSIPEGAVNLYYSNARVHANLRLASINALLDVDTATIPPQAGYALIWNGVRWIPNVITATALTGPVDYSNIAQTANVANTVLSLNNFTTANLVEGDNLYYTNTRMIANLLESSISVFADVDTTTVPPVAGQALSWNGAAWIPGAVNATNALTSNVANIVVSLSNHTTSNLAEGTNLYYTNARVYANVTPLLELKANVTDLTTANIAELNNLYYTNTRSYSNLTLASINALADVDTATVPPVSGQALSWNGAAWIPATVVASYAPYSGEANIANTATRASFAAEANVANTVLSLRNFTTSNLAEGSNLYYTDARVYANLSLANINVLADVQAVNPTTGQVLYWNGSYWEANSVTIPSTEYANIANTVVSIVQSAVTANAANFANLALFANAAEIANFANTTSFANVAGFANITSFANAATVANVAYGANIANTVLTLSNFTTANLAEGNNLYYTNARVYANVEPLLALKANVVDLTTANVAELNNLYYTDDRVYTNVTARLGSVNMSIVPEEDELYDLGAPGKKWKDLYLSGFSLTLGNTKITSSGAGGLSVDSLVSNTSILTKSITANVWNNLYTANVKETSGNLYYTNARVYANVIPLLNLKANIVDLTTANVAELNNLYYTNARVRSAIGLTTADPLVLNYSNVTGQFAFDLGATNTDRIAEGNVNLYYTNARVRSALSGGTGVTYNNGTGQISIGQDVSTTSNVTFGALNVTGEINFYGNVTTHSSNNLSISDNMIYLNQGSETSNPDLGFAGNYNDGSYHHAGFFRDATDGKWKVYDNYAPEPGSTIFIDTDHATFRLANLAATTFFGNVQGTVSTLSNFSTTDLAEGNNLYYTNARVLANVTPLLNLKANVVDLTTANVVELNNLYYTNARVLSNVSQMSINVLSDVDITGIGTNGTLIWNGSAFVAGVASTASEANFANAAGTANVAAFATIANYANTAGFASTADVANTSTFATTANVANTVLTLSNFSTTDLAEGNNLYYTNTRTYSNITALLPVYSGNIGAGNVTIGSGTGGSLIGANLISAVNISAENWLNLYTSNVAELNNLYYTNARVLSNVEQMSINVFADVDITNIQPNDTLVWDGTKFVKALAGQTAAIIANVTTTGDVEITRFSTSNYITAKYVYTLNGTSVGYTGKFNSGEILVMHDDTNTFITQYAMLSNDDNLDLLTFSSNINNGNVIIYGNVSDPAIQVTVKLTGATYTAK